MRIRRHTGSGLGSGQAVDAARTADETATAVPIVPHVPWEWTFGRGVVAPPRREHTS